MVESVNAVESAASSGSHKTSGNSALVVHRMAAATLSAPSWCSRCRGFLWGLKEWGVRVGGRNASARKNVSGGCGLGGAVGHVFGANSINGAHGLQGPGEYARPPQTVVKKATPRGKLASLLSPLAPCIVRIDASSSAAS